MNMFCFSQIDETADIVFIGGYLLLVFLDIVTDTTIVKLVGNFFQRIDHCFQWSVESCFNPALFPQPNDGLFLE